MDFVNDIDRDEIRSGFLVKSDRKKLWNVMLGCYNEFRRTCEKYNIRFFADGGTLLGAVRHRGFIPWDDDMDFSMLRPDYERFKEVARNEITYPYFCDIWYENEGIEECATETTLGSFIRIHDERTTAIIGMMKNPAHRGICIDIFPLDSCPNLNDYSYQDGDDKASRQWQIITEFARACLERDKILEMLADEGIKTVVPKDQLIRFAMLPLREKGEMLEKYCLKFFHDSRYLSIAISRDCILSSSYRDIIELPFENTTIPAPVGYEKYLAEIYGNWREFVINAPHVDLYSPDISYKDFLKMRDDRLN